MSGLQELFECAMFAASVKKRNTFTIMDNFLSCNVYEVHLSLCFVA